MSLAKPRNGTDGQSTTLCQPNKAKKYGSHALNPIQAQASVDESFLEQSAVRNPPDRINVVLPPFEFPNPIVSVFHRSSQRYLRKIA
jgi:hypothetical protein